MGVESKSKNQYEEVCKDRFSILEGMIKDSHEATTRLNKRLFESNGERALVELVRDNKMENQRLASLVEEYLVNVPDKTAKKLTASLKDGIDISGYNAIELVKILLGFSIAFLLIVGNYDKIQTVLQGKIFDVETSLITEE